MRQKAYSDRDILDGKPVSVAEIATRRDDILYGSFRAKYKLVVPQNTEGGAVSKFFFHHVCVPFIIPTRANHDTYRVIHRRQISRF